MKTKPLETLLNESVFFKDFDVHALSLLAGCGKNVVFRPDVFLFRHGSDSHEFYLIRAGKVALEINVPGRGAMIIQTLQEGDVLGWSWMVPPYRKQFDGRAVELTRAILFDGGCIRKKCEEDPRLGYEFFKRFAVLISQRLSAMRLQLMDLYAKS